MKAHVEISVVVPGASEVEIARGVAAAWSVFNRAGYWPWDCARASFERERPGQYVPGGADDPEEPVTAAQLVEDEQANTWCRAMDAAFEAACLGWTSIPEGREFQLLGERRFTVPA